MYKVLEKIAKVRSARIEKSDMQFGYEVPKQRQVPLVKPDFLNGLVIAEIKRSSPSIVNLNKNLNHLEQSKLYVEAGAGAISVLTEEDHFGGSLLDLMQVKEQNPQSVILRKDFIQYLEEIEVTYRAGADMILLIVAMFNDSYQQRLYLKKLYDLAIKYGLTVLVEVHDENELEVAHWLGANLIGINTRDLNTFNLDHSRAFYLMNKVRGDAKIIYESGISSQYQAFIAGANNFSGILVGTHLVKSNNPYLELSQLIESLSKGMQKPQRFFSKLFANLPKSAVKICGITNVADAQIAIKYGATALGFIMCKSPRQISVAKIKEICANIDYSVLKVAVVDEYNEQAEQLCNEGIIDAIQYHGFHKDDDFLNEANYSWYRAINIEKIEDYCDGSISPLLLLDSVSANNGGSGKCINMDLLSQLNDRFGPLAIAGGITPRNASVFYSLFKPKMLDCCSGVEAFAGKKDAMLIQQLFCSLK